MILDYQNLKFNVEDFNKIIHGTAFIQKMYSTSRYIAIAIRIQGETIYLYLGRGNKYEGIWPGKKPPSSQLRKKDQFLEYLRKYLTGGILNALILDQLDRIVYLQYAKNGNMNYLGLFWKARQLYFNHLYFDLEKNKFIKFCSWDNNLTSDDHNKGECKELMDDFDRIGRRKLESNIKIKLLSNNLIEDLLEEENSELVNIDSKKNKFLEKKLLNIRNDLDKCHKWVSLKQKVENNRFPLKQLLSQKKFIIDGIEFKNENAKTEHQLKNLIYDKIKKLRSGEVILIEREKLVKEELDQLKNEKSFLNNLKVIRPVWNSSKKEVKIPTSNQNLSYIIFQINNSNNNIKFAIGLSAQGNDQLRKNFASKDNIWMHIENIPSAHLVVKATSINELNNQDIQILASALNYYSKSKLTQIPILYTQVKHIRAVKGSAGLVRFSKEKYLVVTFLENWKDKLTEITH